MVTTERKIENQVVAKSGKMLNPFDRPTLIIRDGAHIPTCKGLFHSSQTKLIIAASNLRPKEKSQVIKQSSVYENILPFIMRGLAIWEMTRITEPTLNREQIRRAVYRKNRPEWHMPPKDYIDPKNEATRRSKGTINGLQKKLNKQTLTDRKNEIENERKSIEFIKKLLESKLITKDISIWQKLHEIYRYNRRSLSNSVFNQLRLEMFLAATIKREYESNFRLLILYDNLGKNIDREWFKTSLSHDENLIRNYVRAAWLKDSNDDDFEKRNRIKEMVKNGTNAEANKASPPPFSIKYLKSLKSRRII